MSIPEAFINNVRLCELLPGLSAGILETWCESGYLVPIHYEGYQPQYTTHSVDTLLAQAARGFTSSPTVRSLAAREVNFMGPPLVAADILEVPQSTLLELIDRGYIQTLDFDSLRLVAYAATDHQLPISRHEASLLTGISTQILRSLVIKGVLKTVGSPNHLMAWPITWGSLQEFLRTALPSFISPALWRSRRLGDGRPLLSKTEVARQMNTTEKRVDILFATEALWYIKVPDKREKYLIDPKSVDILQFEISGQADQKNTGYGGVQEWHE